MILVERSWAVSSPPLWQEQGQEQEQEQEQESPQRVWEEEVVVPLVSSGDTCGMLQVSFGVSVPCCENTRHVQVLEYVVSAPAPLFHRKMNIDFVYDNAFILFQLSF